MRHFLLSLVFFSALGYTQDTTLSDHYAIVIHGGAGTISKKTVTPEKEKEIYESLTTAINLGKKMLEEGKEGLVVIEEVIKYLENNSLFNAGKGSVYNAEGHQEMDACIMDGRDLSTGAVAGVSHLKNPIVGARIVKDSTRHILLSGERAEKFCLDRGAEYADSAYFYVKRRYDHWKKIDDKRKGIDDGGMIEDPDSTHKRGTVGCVVLDRYGNLAAGTSTGGLTYKEYGRIGDSPIVGAGTYASNESCAVSCTGTGEYFMRATVSRDISALMEFKGVSLMEAGAITLNKITQMEGDGGFIAVDKNGDIIMLFNTEGMYRASASSDQPKPFVGLYKE